MTATSHKIRFDEDDLLFSEQFEDHYFSRHDGRAECCHVFIAGNGLPGRFDGRDCFTIGELGFGTGLNLLVTWQVWKQVRRPGQSLHFASVEGFPLERSTAAKALANWPDLAHLADELLDCWDELGKSIQLDNQTTLHVHHAPVESALSKFPCIDAWYLDGFAPSKNPDMWSTEVMQLVAGHTAPGGSFASYTAAGWVRRNLAQAGFDVEKRPGFGTKRDMIAGVLR